MKTFTKIAVASVTALLLIGGQAHAQSRNGVHISGNVANNTNVVNQTTQATRGAVAATSIGTIHGGTNISGTLRNTTFVRNQRTLASGRGSKACTAIGSVGNDANCSR